MNKLSSLKNSSFKKTACEEECENNKENDNQVEKILCNHCGRTASNGIRCLGICVADNDY